MTDPMEPNEPHESFEPIAPAPPRPAPVAKKGPYSPSPLPGIVAGLGLGAVLVGAGIVLAQMLPKKEEPAPSPTPVASPAAPTPPEAKPDPVAALTTQVDGLGKRLDDVQKHLAEMPKPEPAPDLKPLEAKVDALSKRLDAAGTPDTKAIEDKAAQAAAAAAEAQAKLDAVAKAIASQKEEIAGLKDQVKSLSESKPAPAASATTPAASPAGNAAAEADYGKAVDLFKKNQFAPARDAFVKLTESMPNDARVWYYAALSNGYATNVWNGDTEKYVLKGKELEKAGQPDAAKVNATFAELPAATKSWLDAYRNR